MEVLVWGCVNKMHDACLLPAMHTLTHTYTMALGDLVPIFFLSVAKFCSFCCCCCCQLVKKLHSDSNCMVLIVSFHTCMYVAVYVRSTKVKLVVSFHVIMNNGLVQLSSICIHTVDCIMLIHCLLIHQCPLFLIVWWFSPS